VDWQLLILFIGLFVIVGAFHDSGLAQKGLNWVEAHGLDLKKPLVLTLTTGVLSNLINNSAAVMLLVKLVDLTNHTNAYIMALANTFAGNLFLIGSVANIIVVQCAENCGVKISFGRFAKYGIPTALASYAFLIIWILIMA
jgi:Na+/H+ antiporter NhaD/arsenite permease-like protein